MFFRDMQSTASVIECAAGKKEAKVKILLGILFLLHGLISAMQAKGTFNPTRNRPNPDWIGWWRVSFGTSWLIKDTAVKNGLGTVFGFLWIAAGALLFAAGLSLLGIIIPNSLWRTLAGTGASVSLVILFIYVHPFYGIGILANLAILIVLLWMKWPTPVTLGF